VLVIGRWALSQGVIFDAGYHRRSLAETAMMRLKTIFSG
jgi:hypothetical protein